MADKGRVDVDTSGLERGMMQLARGLDAASPNVASREARSVADRVRARTPVRTGRLAATIHVESGRDGASVHYGGTLPYADYIDHRTHATESALSGTDDRFVAAMRTAAATQIRKL